MKWLLLVPISMISVVGGWLVAHLVHRYSEDPHAEIAVLADTHCPHCNLKLELRDTSPLQILRTGYGCPRCTLSLPSSWMGTQLSVPLLAVGTALAWGIRWSLIPLLWLVVILVTASAVDLRLMLIPRRVAWVGFWVGAALIAAVSILGGDPNGMLRAAAGSALYFGLLFVVHTISPRGMGFGDVRLAATLGLYLGWITPMLTFVGLFIACLVGVVTGLAVRIRSHGQAHFPFGPGLAAGTLLTVWAWVPWLDRVLVH